MDWQFTAKDPTDLTAVKAAEAANKLWAYFQANRKNIIKQLIEADAADSDAPQYQHSVIRDLLERAQSPQS